MSVNQPSMFPRFPGSGGFSFRRSYFLDGTLKCFYGPAQRPDSGDQPGTDSTGGEAQKAYTPAVDWPAPGSFLRVPQVVFFSKNIDQQLTPSAAVDCWTDSSRGAIVWSTDECNGEFSDPADVYWSHVRIHGTLPPTDDAEAEEDARIDSVFAQVVAWLQEIRPNRTFATYWSDWSVTPFPTGGIDNYGMDFTMQHLLAPPLTETEFFGTDFLHVYCGLPAANDQNGVVGLCISGGLVTNPTPDENNFFLGSQERLQQAFPLFTRYAAWVWTNRIGGSGVDWTRYDGDIESPIELENVMIGDAYDEVSKYFEPDYVLTGGSYEDCDPTFTFTPGSERPNPYITDPNDFAYLFTTAPPDAFGTPSLPVTATQEDMAPLILAAMATVLASLNDAEETAGEFLRACCEECSDQGVQFNGVTADVDVLGLQNLIAAHFGFDPVTGKDL